MALQLCEPFMDAGSWYDQIQTSGPGVHSITLTVENVRETADAMAKLGFHLELGEKPPGIEIPFLYRPI